MKREIEVGVVLIFVVLLSGVVLVSGQSVFGGGGSAASSSTHQYAPSTRAIYSQSDINTYWPQVGDAETCRARQDVILQVSPVGCQPAVVRSDLLAEQNVPVFCQIDALQINPLVDIKEIENIRFRGNYPEEVVGSGFHPARAALRSQRGLLGSPIINNIGYVVVVLKRQPEEDKLPESVSVDLSAQVQYDSGNALGIGKAEFLLEPVRDEVWEAEKNKNSFWQGRYFVRADEVSAEEAKISIYHGDRRISSVNVEKGKVSKDIFVPGFYCRGGLQVAYDGFVSAEKRARLEVTDDEGSDSFEVFKGSRFLNDKCTVKDIKIEDTGFGKVEVTCRGSGSSASESFDLELKAIEGTDGTEVKNADLGEKKKEFDEVIAAFERVADDYPAEKGESVVGSGIVPYGEAALREAADFAREKGQQATQVRLLQKLIDLYPNSEFAGTYATNIGKLIKEDRTKAAHALETDNRYRVVRLVDLIPGKGEPGRASFSYGGKDFSLKQGDKNEEVIGVKVGDGKQKAYVELTDLKADEVSIRTNCDEGRVKRVDLKVGEGKEVCASELVLKDIDVEKIAKIRLIPKVQGTATETNLTVNIGIEKRAIQLSPEKTTEMIDNLDESIEKWGQISDRLEKVVKGMKGACFATAGVLTVKNFLSGLSGESIARGEVMNGPNGWTNVCKKKVAESPGEYPTMNACFLKHASEINGDVAKTTQVLGKFNQEVGVYNKKHEINSDLFGKSVDNEEVTKDLIEELKGKELVITMPEGKEWDVYDDDGKISDSRKSVSVKEIAEGSDLSFSEARELLFAVDRNQAGGLSAEQNKNVESALSDFADRINGQRAVSAEFDKNARLDGLPTLFTSGGREGKILADVASIGNIKVGDDVSKAISNNCPDGTHAARVRTLPRTVGDISVKDEKFGDGNYILCLGQSTKTKEFDIVGAVRINKDGSGVEKLLDGDESVITGEELGEFRGLYGLNSNIKSIEQISYENPISNPLVRFYETEPYRGLPAIVPFDRKKGWYAATRPTLPVLGGIGAFDSSGAVKSFWLCNVDGNNRIDFDNGIDDDICELINLNTGQTIRQFPGLTQAQAEAKVREAISAITEASNQFGNPTIRIGSDVFERGGPMASVPSTQCQDFMSPTDCHLLFNMCDPVICPASRCNLGGKYHVADVIQSGVVGSALLCLPNIREKIYVPVCLTGIQAGIDGYVSILESHQACLEESLASGRSVGICDEIYSIYTCEFFWRQVAPVANIILPKLVEGVTGQGTRGGGEYLTVQGAWDNAQKSVDFFTQEYAVNSLKAFNTRNVEEAGGQFCKAFISAKGPSAFESLIEPDSPPQFHAYFDAIRFSDATVPATSQYKVFYHIFAGNDAGVTYSVYLKGAPESGFFNVPASVQVAHGFITRGEFATETKDFTAPEGYKELCVRINNDEKCGFSQVSTSFAINSLADGFVADESKRTDITSEKACVSGQPNLGGLLRPNLQAGAENALFPQISDRGLIRICATQNPGISTNPGRFADVGYCGDKKIRCWVDRESVKDAIGDENKGVLNSTLEDLDAITREQLAQQGLVLNEGPGEEELDSLDAALANKEDGKTILSRIELVRDKFVINAQKARLLLIRARVLAKGFGKVVIGSGGNGGADEPSGDDKKTGEYHLRIEELTEGSGAYVHKLYDPEGDYTGVFADGSLVVFGQVAENNFKLGDLKHDDVLGEGFYFDITGDTGGLTGTQRRVLSDLREGKPRFVNLKAASESNDGVRAIAVYTEDIAAAAVNGDGLIKEVLKFDVSSNYEVELVDDCKKTLETRKEGLDIPDKICYWDIMVDIYDDKCKNLNEGQVKEIFEKKRIYREEDNDKWPALNSDGDFCVPVIYDCDAWVEEAEQSSQDSRTSGAAKTSHFSFGERKGEVVSAKIYLNPYIEGDNLKRYFRKDVLVHEGLHTVQSELFEDKEIIKTSQFLSSGAERSSEAKKISETIRDKYNKLAESQLKIDNNEGRGRFLRLLVDAVNTHYPSTQRKRFDELKEFLKEENAFEKDEEDLISEIYDLNIKRFGLLYEDYARDYLSNKREIDPRLSEVNRWWLDKTGPTNCEVVTDVGKAEIVLDAFMAEDFSKPEYKGAFYQQTQNDLAMLLYFAGIDGKLGVVHGDMIARLPGLAQGEGDDGTAFA